MPVGSSSKPRGDFNVTRGWPQMMNAIGWIEQFADKITAEFVAPILKRPKLSIQQRHPQCGR